MKSRLISFKEIKEKQIKTAFDWAVREQEKLRFSAPEMYINFDSDCLPNNESGCELALFHDEETGRTILRRYWPEYMGLAYNIVTNYDEIERVAPNSLRAMLDNGVNIYNRERKTGSAFPKTKETTTSSRQIILHDNKILDFEEIKNRQLKTAYDWVRSEQKTYGFLAEFMYLNFKNDNHKKSDKCEIALFHDEETGRTILRRYWPECRSIKYDIVTNYDEIERVAPNSLRTMLDDGVNIYNRKRLTGSAFPGTKEEPKTSDKKVSSGAKLLDYAEAKKGVAYH